MNYFEIPPGAPPNRGKGFLGSTKALLVAATITVSLGAGAAFAGPDDRPDELAVSSLPEVSGVVTMDGKPVANATILFSSEKGPAGRVKTDAQGRYVVKTPGQEDGLAPGTYTVTITANEEHEQGKEDSKQEEKPAADNVLPQRFASPEATGLRVMIVEGSNDFQFDLSK